MSDVIENLRSEGKGKFSCPSCGARASDALDYPYCPRGCTEERMLGALADRPPKCEEKHELYSDEANKCEDCQTEIAYARQVGRQRADELLDRTSELASMRVPGDYMFDIPQDTPIWGTGPDHLLSAEGQGWMIVGPDGTGKTTAASDYVKARLGMADKMWDLPVKPLPEDQSVYYLAMDRPRQMMQAFMRGVSRKSRPLLKERLFIHRGPPPHRLGRPAGHEWLLREVEQTRSGLVVFDSRKDVGNTLDAEDVLGVATVVQSLVAADVDVLILAHPTKGRRNGPPLLEDVSGFREVFSGLGSVLFLDGKPGDSLVTVHQVKPIQERAAPFKVLHDHAAGTSERLPEGIVPGDGTGDLAEGRMPVDALEVKVLACIDAHPDGTTPSKSLKEVLGSDNLSRDLRALIERKVVEHNGQRGGQSGYRRGPEAPRQ